MNNLHLVMHATGIKRNGQAREIASISGLAESEVATILESGVASGRIVQVEDNYLLTPAGRMILDSEYSRFCNELRSHSEFINAYKKFEIINRELKQLITEWQTVEAGGLRIPNDHSDADYDQKIIGRLGDIHEQFEPILDIMVAVVERFSGYQNKLQHALEKAEDGEIIWISEVRVASYHTIWFELHEDLLRLLGQTRED